MEKSVIDWVALVLVIIGGISWGIFGLLNVDIVAELFGSMTIISRVIYILVGISSLWMIYFLTKE